MGFKYTDDEFIEAVRTSFTIGQTLRKLGISDKGANYRTFHSTVRKFNLDISHFTGKAHGTSRTGDKKTKIKLVDILIENSSYKNSSTLRKRLIYEGVLKNKCSICDLFEWKGKHIILHLDHINGIHTDNRIENLRILCPNCHSQTETYCNRNIKNRHKSREKHNLCKCGNKKSFKASLCLKCCYLNRNKIDWPSKENLIEMINKSNAYQISKKLGVSWNGLKKHLLKINTVDDV